MSFDIWQKGLLRKSLLLIVLLQLLLVLIWLSAYILQWFEVTNALNSNREAINTFSVSGSVGDTINGLFAPIIGIAAVVTTFLAFAVQYQANESQRKDIKRERFENQFYQMLNLHKQNVAELEISGRHSGRKAFVRMYYEYRFLYQILRKICLDNKCKEPDDLVHQISRVAYHFFLYGIDEFSEPLENEDLPHDLQRRMIQAIQTLQRNYQSHYGNCLLYNWEIINHPYVINIGDQVREYETDFYPFDGHTSKLGHYYRHLYQLIKYAVIEGDKIDLSYKEKYSYIRLIRAQLSNHEQALIYLNSFWRGGEVWWIDNAEGKTVSYFLDYAIVKNLPFNLVNHVGPQPESEFSRRLGDGPYYRPPIGEENGTKTEVSFNQKMDWLFEARGG